MANLFPKLVVTVGMNGTTTTDFVHFTGAGCLDASHTLHTLLAEYGIETEIVGMTPKPALLSAGQPGQVALAEIAHHEGGM